MAGARVGGFLPELGKALEPLGTGFVDPIRMMTSPVTFCTIVLGTGSVRKAAQAGSAGSTASRRRRRTGREHDVGRRRV